MENKDFLISLLTLTQSLKAKDQVAIDAAIEALNAISANEDNLLYLKDFIKNVTESKEILLYMVENLDLITDKEYFRTYIEIRTAVRIPKEKLVDYLNTTITFTDDYDKYLYYSVLTKKVIDLGDPILIKAAIDKIQSI